MNTRTTDSEFKSACASGENWRVCLESITKELKEHIEDVANKRIEPYNFGIVYVSDALSDDLEKILGTLKILFGFTNWTGSVAMGVIGTSSCSNEDQAISVMIAKLPEDSFYFFDVDELKNSDTLKQWTNDNPPLISYVHGNPLADGLREELTKLANKTHSFILGGITTARYNFHTINKGQVSQNACSGVLFSNRATISTCLSQGARAFSDNYTITKSDYTTILEINHRPATDVLTDVLRAQHREEAGMSKSDYKIELQDLESIDFLPEEFIPLLKGQTHVGFTFPNVDTAKHYVREINNIDVTEKSISINEVTQNGQQIFFAHRNEDIILCDLQSRLDETKQRIINEYGHFKPKAAIYISCLGSGMNLDKSMRENELKTLHKTIGDIPLIGYYAGGEISNAHIYNFSTILILFL